MADNFTTPVPSGLAFAGKDIGGVQYPRNIITDITGADAMGIVGDPAGGTLLGLLDVIASNQAQMIALLTQIAGGASASPGTLDGSISGNLALDH